MDEARRLLDFIDDAPTPFHAVKSCADSLRGAGFVELSARGEWTIEAGGQYFLIQNEGALVAFRAPESEPRAFTFVGAHTDSPNLRLKPRPTEFSRAGWRQLGVEVYGGVLLNSWLDRDLGIAGRVAIEDGSSPRIELVRMDRPLCRVPQLAIHLDRTISEEGLKLNAQQHLPPVLGLEGGGPAFEELLAEAVGTTPERLLDFELMLYSLQPSTVGGAQDEFLFAPRLDNLAMCHAGIGALLDARGHSHSVQGIALFDHEEVGSVTMRGAGSPLVQNTLERVFGALGGGRGRERLLAALDASVFVSADMAHAVHPNYKDRHDEQHYPQLNAGPVIKHNASARYATDTRSSAWFEQVCRSAGIGVQKFVNRSDLACGSTIGPITAARLGVSVVDVGAAMLSMHSAREMAGSRDPSIMRNALSACLSSTPFA